MRHLPHTNEEVVQMLRVIGAASIEDLFKSIPSEFRSKSPLSIPEGMGEEELSSHMLKLSAKNRATSSYASFLGAGAYRHYIPAAVSELASRSEFVTPYTPYQPEISQGTLQVLFEYQSQISRLFEMDVSNASHYSGATALADATLMAQRITKGRKKIIAPANLHPEYRETLKTYLSAGAELVTISHRDGLVDRGALKSALCPDTAAVISQFPNFFGIVEDLNDVSKMAHDADALFIVSVPEPISLGILTPPGRFGADIAVGEGLSLGLPVSFGGPTLGIFTARKEYVRQMPGRICGKTVDRDGRAGYVLTLSTREQHIRREKATSNICSNQALCATTAAIYLSLLGKTGMRELALINTSKTAHAKKMFSSLRGAKLRFNSPTFNEFVIECERPAKDILVNLEKRGVLGGADLGRWYPEFANCILVCVTELNTLEEIERYASAWNQRPLV